MLRKLLCMAVILAGCVGITLAAEINALIYKVDGNKVTFKENKGRGMDPGPEQTLEIAKDVKVTMSKFDMDKMALVTEDVKDGLKAAQFKDIDKEKGLRGTIVTDDKTKNVTEIKLGGGRGGRGMRKGM
jgi:hypothetical protein